MAFKSTGQPHCVCCNKRIAKLTECVLFGMPDGTHSFAQKDRPIVRSKDEAARHVNQPIVHVSYRDVTKYNGATGEYDKVDRVVATVSIWDGESYVDGWFCNGSCRTRWAYMTAKRAWPDGSVGIKR